MSAASPASRSDLAPAFSTYLDLLRGGSALWVAISHLHLFGVAGRSNRLPLPDDGHDAVVLFFILSGFLVAHAVVRKPQQGLLGFALDRASRIYSVALPLLIASFICAGLGVIHAVPVWQMEKWPGYFLFFTSFLNQSLGYREVPLLLYPWWSLAFEVWYYVLFGCAVFLRGKTRWIVCGAVFVLMGGNLWLLLPVWLGGVMALLLPSQNWSRHVSLFAAVASAGSFVLIKYAGLDELIRAHALAHWGGLHAHPFGNASYFSADFLTTPLVVVHLAAMRRLLTHQQIPLASAIKAFAGISFTLYLLHALIYRIWVEGLGHGNGGTLETITALVLAVAASFAIAPLTEYRRVAWRKGLASIAAFFGWREENISR